MPVPAKVRSMLGDDHEVARAGDDVAAAAGTRIHLACLIRLDGLDHERSERGVLHGYPPSKAQSTTSNVITTNTITTTTSTRVLSC